jgi:hypothetical protein
MADAASVTCPATRGAFVCLGARELGPYCHPLPVRQSRQREAGPMARGFYRACRPAPRSATEVKESSPWPATLEPIYRLPVSTRCRPFLRRVPRMFPYGDFPGVPGRRQSAARPAPPFTVLRQHRRQHGCLATGVRGFVDEGTRNSGQDRWMSGVYSTHHTTATTENRWWRHRPRAAGQPGNEEGAAPTLGRNRPNRVRALRHPFSSARDSALLICRASS